MSLVGSPPFFFRIVDCLLSKTTSTIDKRQYPIFCRLSIVEKNFDNRQKTIANFLSIVYCRKPLRQKTVDNRKVFSILGYLFCCIPHPTQLKGIDTIPIIESCSTQFLTPTSLSSIGRPRPPKSAATLRAPTSGLTGSR